MPELTETITTPSVLPGAASGCETADEILCADEVQPGDLMLYRGRLVLVESVSEDHGQPAYVGLYLQHAGLQNGTAWTWQLRHHLVAVRRYVTSEG